MELIHVIQMRKAFYILKQVVFIDINYFHHILPLCFHGRQTAADNFFGKLINRTQKLNFVPGVFVLLAI